MGKPRPWLKKPWVQILVLPVTYLVTLDKLLDTLQIKPFSVPIFLVCKVGIIIGFKKIIYIFKL